MKNKDAGVSKRNALTVFIAAVGIIVTAAVLVRITTGGAAWARYLAGDTELYSEEPNDIPDPYVRRIPRSNRTERDHAEHSLDAIEDHIDRSHALLEEHIDWSQELLEEQIRRSHERLESIIGKD